MGVTLTTPVRGALGVPVVVEIFDAEMAHTATAVLVVGRRHDLERPSGPHATVVVHTPSGHSLGGTVPLGPGSPGHREIDIGPLGEAPGMLRAALTTLVPPRRTPWTVPGGLWLRMWQRPAAGDEWTPVRTPVLTTVEATALHVRGRAGSSLVQIGGAGTAWRMASLPAGARVDVLVRTVRAGAAAQPVIVVAGADPGADALMAYLTAGRLRHAAVLADHLRAAPGPEARLALAYAHLTAPGTIAAPDGPVGDGCDWTIVGAAALSRAGGDPAAVRSLTLAAWRLGPPLWTAGLRLLADLLRAARAERSDATDELAWAWRELHTLLATADLAAPTVTFPARSPGEVACHPVLGTPPDALRLPAPGSPEPELRIETGEVLPVLDTMADRITVEEPVSQVTAQIGDVTGVLRVRAAGSRFAVEVALMRDGDRSAFAGDIIGLEAGDEARRAVLDRYGRATFIDVPGPPWRWHRQPAARPDAAVRLPEPPPLPALAAHTRSGDSAEPTIVTPDGVELRLRHDAGRQGYELEIEAAPTGTAVLPVRCTDERGAVLNLWLPVQRGARVALAGREVTARAAVPVGEVDVWDSGVLRASTAAALDNGTRLAWLRVLRAAGPDVAYLIDGDLLHPDPLDPFPPSRPPRLPEFAQDLLADVADERPGVFAVRTAGGRLELSGPALLSGALVHLDCGRDRHLLLPLDQAGRGHLPLPRSTAEVRIAGAADPALLEISYAGLVRQSVLVAGPAALDQWRRMGRHRLFGDPIRTTIADALRSLS
ncbi:hypothetical protein Ari01nite_19240 [Paractinoplanes rishiriensis]|uniref:Uncharacterized protein n=2 Tax=Paractinoplanes rishiriensis TaxID=1050105 RepID=A0A919JWB0_9ACTN|nr:hypothetical protein Ari01nite_19240 [Actinoplanes rishiriensis]